MGVLPAVAGRYGPKGKRRLGVTRAIQPFRSDTVQMVLPAVLRGVRTGRVPPEGSRGPTSSAKWPQSGRSGVPFAPQLERFRSGDDAPVDPPQFPASSASIPALSPPLSNRAQVDRLRLPRRRPIFFPVQGIFMAATLTAAEAAAVLAQNSFGRSCGPRVAVAEPTDAWQ